MPITHAIKISAIDELTYHTIDRKVTGIAFDVQNKFGRYLNETIYQRELLRRFQASGFNSVREVKITVSLDDFIKDYFLDFVLDSGFVLEIKAVAALSAAHKAQLLHYLFLCHSHHGTLLNLRSERVQHEFVSTRLTTSQRQNANVDLTAWKPLTNRCEIIERQLHRIVRDWGACLETSLYREALTHFLGGEPSVIQDIEIYSAGESLGKQKVHLVDNDIAFSVTSAIHRPDSVQLDHQRFLNHTRLAALHWINFNRLNVTLQTLHRHR